MEVFETRAAKYNQLVWVSDAAFGRRIIELAQAGPSTIMLDLAAGTGAVSLFFAGQVQQIYLLDSSPSMLEQAKEALRAETNAQYICRDGQDTGLPDELFDFIICRNGLHHFDDPVSGLREIKRILKPDGVFLLIEPVAPNDKAKEPWSELFRVRDKGRHPDFYFTPAELTEYVRQEGFEVERGETLTMSLKLSNWVDIGTLSREETAHILRFVDELPHDLKACLMVETVDGDSVWQHMWALMRIRKAA